MLSSLSVLCTVLAAGPAAPPAQPQGDWFASLYTGEGIELRTDERVFTLFALLNAAGFDQGPVSRKEPVPKVLYSAARQQIRARVIGGDPEPRKAADAFFDAHPMSLGHYLDYCVHASPPPFKDPPKAKDVQDLKGFDQVLAKAWTTWKLDEALAQVQQEYRKTLRSYLPVLDGPLVKARAILKVPDSTEAMVVANLLDQQDSVRAVQGEHGEVMLIVGPADKPNVEGVLREFARLTVDPGVGKAIGGWAGGPAVLREAQVSGVTDGSVREYATSLLSLAVALRALEANDAAWLAAENKGYFGIREVAKMFDDSKPVDTWVLEAMKLVETRRPAKK